MALIIMGAFLIFYALYILIKKQVWLSNEYNDGFLATGCEKDIIGLFIFGIGIVFIIGGIAAK